MRLTSRLAPLAFCIAACSPPAKDSVAEPPTAAAQWYFWTADGVRHFVRELGTGPDTVVVLHGGWGAEHSYLIPALAPLGDEYTFVLYDQRGSLRTPAPDSTIRPARLVADLEHLRVSLGTDRLTLYTHSMGAQLAYLYLKAHPGNVRGLVLQSPVLPRDAPVDTAAASGAWTDFVAFARANEQRQAEVEGLNLDSYTDRQRSDRSRLSLAGGNIFHIDRWRSVEGGQAFYNPSVGGLLEENSTPDDWTGLSLALAEFSGPVTVIIGDHDLVDFGLVNWPAFADYMDHVTLRVLEAAGHNAWIDAPERHAVELRAALARIMHVQTAGDDP